MSNTFLDNVHEPRLNYLKTHAKKVVEEFSASSSSQQQQKQQQTVEGEEDDDAAHTLANLLGQIMLAQPNFSDEELPIEHLNLSAENKQKPIEVELERACQRNISSYCEWLDDGVQTCAPTTNTNVWEEKSKEQEQEQKNQQETTTTSIQTRTPIIMQASASEKQQHQQQEDSKKLWIKVDGQPPKIENDDDTSASNQQQQQQDQTLPETEFMMERHSSDKMVRLGISTPHATSRHHKNHCRFDWGTRTHIIVLSEKIDETKTIIHFFVRSISVKIDETGPRHGVAHQPQYELIPGEWKHLALPHSSA